MGAEEGSLQPVRSEDNIHPEQSPVQHQSRAGKSSVPEETPLLHNESPNDIDAAEAPGDKNRSGSNPSQGRWASIKRWLWRNRLAVCIIILLLGGIAALIAYFAVYDKGGPKASEVCLTSACVQAASVILKAMSPKYTEIDPCVDFNKFSCQGFDDTHDLRPDQGSLFAATIMSEDGQQILRHVLETPYSTISSNIEKHSSAKEAIFKKLKDSYDACMDEDSIKAAGTAPLINILQEVEELLMAQNTAKPPLALHKLPDQTQRNMISHEENSLSQVVVFLTSIDVTTFLSLGVQADDRDPDATVISLDAPGQPGLSSKEYYNDPAIVAKYTQAVGEVLDNLMQASTHSEMPIPSGAFRLLVKGAELAEQIVSLESQLAKATPSEEDSQDITKSYNPMSVEEAQTLLPQVSISYVISHFAPSGYKPTKLIVGSPSYLKAASKILEKTSAETLQAYLSWKTIQSFTYAIEADALKPIKRLNNELKGTDPDAVKERWRTCISRADGDLGWILSKFFVEEAFSGDAKDFGDRIVSEIKAQFVRRLGVADWMSKEVRDLGIQKVHNIIQKIGYPTKSPDIRNSSDLQAYYEPVDITKYSFFNNTLSVAKASIKREWSALGKPTDRAKWDMTADTVNAYYNPAGNEIVFPAGIMQSPVFYSPDVPQYLSYGAFGAISGHELSHAFDSTGRHYDETGNYTDWWDDKTIEEFEKKTQCFIDQYHNFTIKTPDGGSLHVNGKLTLGENIADAGGINAAFASWKRSEAKNPGQLLPGLQQFTKEQLFFISYSMFWCGKIRPEAAVNRIYVDPHSPAWARILGTTANSADFRKAFSCPVKEPTCELW